MAAAGADVVWVGLGTPKQDHVVERLRDSDHTSTWPSELHSISSLERSGGRRPGSVASALSGSSVLLVSRVASGDGTCWECSVLDRSGSLRSSTGLMERTGFHKDRPSTNDQGARMSTSDRLTSTCARSRHD